MKKKVKIYHFGQKQNGEDFTFGVTHTIGEFELEVLTLSLKHVRNSCLSTEIVNRTQYSVNIKGRTFILDQCGENFELALPKSLVDQCVVPVHYKFQ